MRIVCEKSELQRSVNIVGKAVAIKSTTPLLEGMLLQADEDQLTLFGSDEKVSIKCKCRADVLEPGKIVLPARLFSEILAKFDECELTLTTQENEMVMACGHSQTTLRYMDADQYPDFPTCAEDNGAALHADQMISMIEQTAFAASVNEDKPILTGILLEITGSQACMVALDGYRLALRREDIQYGPEMTEMVVPARAMRDVARIIPEDESTVKIHFGAQLVRIVCADVEVIARVLEGEYVKYKNILPKEYATRVIVNKTDLQNSLERASIMARQSKANVVHMKLDGKVMTATSVSEVGQAKEEIEIDLSGKNLDIAFNVQYLLDVLKEIDDEQIVMDLNTSISPCMIHPVSGERFLYMVLPVKTNNLG